jgi:ABC-2 type transport system permease protein
MERTRPYVAAFSSRFLQMLQYRAAAVAGATTQLWWGMIKIMVYAAFYRFARGTDAPMSLAQVITYTWMSQAFIALSAWMSDPEIGAAVRSGTIGYDRMRPVDLYAFWYVRAAGWMLAKVVPRAAIIVPVAGIGLPAFGLRAWAWAPPPNLAAAACFAISMLLVIALSSSIVMWLNLAVITILNDRGVNSVLGPITVVLSGNLLPLTLYPSWMRGALFVQPFAGLVDIPFRIYSGNLSGGMAWAGIGLQLFWTTALIAGGRLGLERVMGGLEMQGG